MKHSRYSCLLSFALLLAIICSFTTAMAYDFEVDGIYYNITSTTTVEVTYKDTNYASYSGNMTIPCAVTCNDKTYTVTAIGDYAFYNSEGTYKLTIPETVLSIGECAFYGCHPNSTTCLAIEAPTLNNSFDTQREWRFDYWFTSDTSYVLYVKPEAYMNYSGWRAFFNHIIIQDEYSSSDFSFQEEESYDEEHYWEVISAKIYVSGSGVIFYSKYRPGDWHEYDSNIGIDITLDEMYRCLDESSSIIDVFFVAVEDGKLPSQVCQYNYYIPVNYLPPIFEFDTYKVVQDGICYYHDANSCRVVPDIHIIGGTMETEYSDAGYYVSGGRLDIYKGNVVIPDSVSIGGKSYCITEIEDGTFGSYFGMMAIDHYSPYYIDNYNHPILEYGFIESCDIKSLIVPNSVYTIGANVFAGCESLVSVTIPSSIKYIGPTYPGCYGPNQPAFYGCNNLHYIHLTGDGEWQLIGEEECYSDGLYVNIPWLDIASGITAIPGLKVNPREVYCYAAVPPTCDEYTFTDYTGTLHVPESSLAAYFTAPYWCNFANIVGDAIELTDLTTDRDSVELVVGEQLTLTASVQPNNASADKILWSSSNEIVAKVVDGVVIAKAQGECDIIATCLDKWITFHVSVKEILPDSIILNIENVMMEKDSALTLMATVLPEFATYNTVTWSSSDTAVAIVNSDGVVTAKAEGECDIIATCKGLTATCHVKVLDRFIYITLDEHRVSLLPNHILTLTPTVTPLPTDLVVTSSNPSVAAARLANGKVQVVGVTVGAAIIKVASADGKAFADSCIVNVYTDVGDVDSDGFVKIADVTSLIDYLLSGNATGISVDNADCNFDNNVNIADVTALIDYLLSGNTNLPTTNTFIVNGVSFKMVRVTGGSFMMGATDEYGGESGDDERPGHMVTLSNFFIGETEVTQELWMAVMGSNPSFFTDNPQRPVERVSWNSSKEFISKLNQMTGKSFRLPTEAEWEFAARGGNHSQDYKYAGSDNINNVAWYWGNIPSQSSGTSGYGTQTVATKTSNELGIYDMSGNVWEWCQDWYDSYIGTAQTNPTGPESGSNRVMRGGCWNHGSGFCRVSGRNSGSATASSRLVGLRLAL